MMNKILAAIYQHASSTPEKIALTGQTTQLTYAQLAAQIDELATWLSTQNIGRAGLWGENSIEWVVADLAAWKAGITLVPLPRFFSRTCDCTSAITLPVSVWRYRANNRHQRTKKFTACVNLSRSTKCN
jgi:acyl-CoA synthetase (AMP-forming)/AMP-acid ligase II